MIARQLVRRARSVIFRRLNRLRLQRAASGQSNRFVLAMVLAPNLVHAAIPALRLVVPHHPVVIVNNGLRAWERTWLRKEFPALEIVDLLTSSWRGQQVPIGHGDVMRQLAQSIETNFGFIDPDCYVFEATLIPRIVEASRRAPMAAAFWYHNSPLAFDVPDTFLIGINREECRGLTERQRAEFGVVQNVSARLKAALDQKWPGDAHYPHPWKQYFDTVHALALSAAVEGKSLAFITSEPGDVIHVGGTSYHTGSDLSDSESDPHRLNAHFFHLLLLERQVHPGARAEFAALVRHYESSASLLRRHPSFARSDLCGQTFDLLAALERRGVI